MNSAGQKKPSNVEAAPGAKTIGSALNIMFPPDRVIWQKVREVVGDLAKRQDAACKFADDDPVVVFEVMRASNAMAFSEGKPAITTTRAAFIRLGSQASIERLEKLKEIPDPSDPDIARYLGVCRRRCRRVGKVAGILAQRLAPSLVEDAQTAGILMPIGDMIALMHFGKDFVKLASENARAKLLYRLEKDLKFDPLKMAVMYLRKNGIPEPVLFPIDPEAQTKTPSRAMLKPICAVAEEMVTAFESERWAKLAPGQNLPPRSAIRLLDLDEPVYQAIYDQVGAYLVSTDPNASVPAPAPR